MKMEQTECSETSEYKLQTPGNHPEESIEHSEHGESLKPRIFFILLLLYLPFCVSVSSSLCLRILLFLMVKYLVDFLCTLIMKRTNALWVGPN